MGTQPIQQRAAGWADWISVLTKQIFALIYKLGVSKERVIQWLEDLSRKHKSAKSDPDPIPEELRTLIAKSIIAAGGDLGEWVQILIANLEDPPAPFRWKVTDLGHHRLVKIGGPPAVEKGLAKGKKYLNKAWIGVWWFTDLPKSPSHQRLARTLKKFNGGIFYKVPSGAGITEYFGFCIVDESAAISVGLKLLEQLLLIKSEEGPRDFRLSASSLNSLAEHETVKASDTLTHPGLFKSVKFNWEYNIYDLLNGRLRDQSLAQAVRSSLKI